MRLMNAKRKSTRYLSVSSANSVPNCPNIILCFNPMPTAEATGSLLIIFGVGLIAV